MSERTQINYRIEVGLLDAIKAAASSQGISYTNWIHDACQEKLAISSQAITIKPAPVLQPTQEDLEATVEQLLDKRIVVIEQRLLQQLEEKLKAQPLGELVAWEKKTPLSGRS